MRKLIKWIFGKKDEIFIEPMPINYSASVHKRHYKYIIPVGGLGKKEAKKKLAELMTNYKKEVVWDDDLGKVYFNNIPRIPITKDFWIPVKNKKNN